MPALPCTEPQLKLYRPPALTPWLVHFHFTHELLTEWGSKSPPRPDRGAILCNSPLQPVVSTARWHQLAPQSNRN